jgi:hypothetical protein
MAKAGLEKRKNPMAIFINATDIEIKVTIFL